MSNFSNLLHSAAFRHGKANNLLALVVLLSSLAVIYSSHKNRHITIAKQKLAKENEQLVSENHNLLIEEGTFTKTSVIEQQAIALGLQVAPAEKIILVPVKVGND